MSVTSSRRILITFSEDVTAQITPIAATNVVSPGKVELVTLASGANTITPPTGGATMKAVTITPPEGNATLITLKGVDGDTGIVLHPTDPTSIALNSPTDTFVLNAAAQVTGVQLIWS